MHGTAMIAVSARRDQVQDGGAPRFTSPASARRCRARRGWGLRTGAGTWGRVPNRRRLGAPTGRRPGSRRRTTICTSSGRPAAVMRKWTEAERVLAPGCTGLAPVALQRVLESRLVPLVLEGGLVEDDARALAAQASGSTVAEADGLPGLLGPDGRGALLGLGRLLAGQGELGRLAWVGGSATFGGGGSPSCRACPCVAPPMPAGSSISLTIMGSRSGRTLSCGGVHDERPERDQVEHGGEDQRRREEVVVPEGQRAERRVDGSTGWPGRGGAAPDRGR